MQRILGVLSAFALLCGAHTAYAQNPFNLTPQQQAQIQAKRKAWEKWRENNKHVSALTQTLMGFAILEGNPKTALTKDQARKIVPILKEWRRRKVMTNEQALKVNRQLTAALTDAQLKKIATAPRTGRGGGMGGGRMGGGNGQGGQRPRFDPSKMPDPKDYNPLNPETLPFEGMRTQAIQRTDKMIKDLTARAK